MEYGYYYNLASPSRLVIAIISLYNMHESSTLKTEIIRRLGKVDKIDVLLVLPPMYQSGRIPDYNPKEPMGLMYVGAMLRREGCSVEILDADILALTLEQTERKIIERGASVVGFSVMQRALPSVKLLAERIRIDGMTSHICCGGFTATLSAKHVLEEMPTIDSIVLGDGEIAFLRLVQAVKNDMDWKRLPGIAFRRNGQVEMGQQATKVDIDSLPWPIRDLLSLCLEKTNYATILTSRGCYGTCTFCSNQSFERVTSGSSWRGRNPVDVVDEICDLMNGYGVRVFKLNDPNLFGPGPRGRQHVVDICEEIVRRGINDLHLMGFCRSNDIDREIAHLMRRAGFERLLIGIESANPEVLRLFRKGESLRTIRQSIRILREVGIDIVPGFMIFNPYTTLETLGIDIDFLETYGFMPTLAKAMRIFDCTPIQEIMASENRLIRRNPFEGYHEYLVDPTVAAVYMALKTISVEWIDLFRKTYQEEIWGIKKAPAFNQRMDFYAMSKSIFLLEKETLKVLISWVRSGFNHQDVVKQVARIKDQLTGIERFIISAGGLSQPMLDIQESSVSDLADRIYSILTSRMFCTFPEQYRWRDD